MRWWNETFADLTDLFPVSLLVIGSVLLAALIALGWYFWPWRLGSAAGRREPGRRGGSASRRFRLGAWRWRLRWRRRRRPRAAVEEAADLPPDELPALPAAALVLSADDFAAAGRYAEAVRERLRAIVRELIEKQVIPASPGWTVTELAGAAAQARPTIAAPLGEAGRTFSEIWYGLRPATISDHADLRSWAAAITADLEPVRAAAAPRPEGAP